MTSTPVSDVGLFFNGIGTKNQVVTGSENESFSQIMSKTATVNVESLSGKTTKSFLDQKNTDFDEKITMSSSNNMKEDVQKTDDKEFKICDKEPEKEVSEELEEDAKKLVKQIADEFGVTEEDVEKVLEELGLSLTSLFQQSDLTQVALMLAGAEDVTQIMTDEVLFTQVNDLLGQMEKMLEDLSNELDMTVEEIMQYVALDEQSSENNLTEVKEQNNVQVLTEEDADNQPVVVEMDYEKISTDNEQNLTYVEVSEKTMQHKDNKGQDMTHSQTEHGQQLLTETNENTFLTQDVVNSEGEFQSYMSFEAEELMQQVLDYIKVSVKPDMSSLHMQLHPEELGTLQIEVTNKNGMLTAHFTTQDESVKAVIESQLIQLKDSLNEQGMKVQAVEVTVASQQFDRNLDQNGRDGSSTEENQKASRKQIRRINLNELDSEDESVLEDDAVRIAAEMMARNGNTIDFMA